MPKEELEQTEKELKLKEVELNARESRVKNMEDSFKQRTSMCNICLRMGWADMFEERDRMQKEIEELEVKRAKLQAIDAKKKLEQVMNSDPFDDNFQLVSILGQIAKEKKNNSITYHGVATNVTQKCLESLGYEVEFKKSYFGTYTTISWEDPK